MIYQIITVCMVEDEIDMALSFAANGIEDGARLQVWPYSVSLSFCTCTTFFCSVCFSLRCVLLVPLICTGLSPEEGDVEKGGGGYGEAQPSPYN